MLLCAAKWLTCWFQICPHPGLNTYWNLGLRKLRDVVHGMVQVMCELQPSCPPGSSQGCHELAGQVESLHVQGTKRCSGWSCTTAHAGGAVPAVLTGLHWGAALSSVCAVGLGTALGLFSPQAGHAAVSESHSFTRSLFLFSGLCLSTLRADSCWTGSCGEETGGKQKHFN